MKKYDTSSIDFLPPTFLPLAHNGTSYVCPVCGSGTGKNGSGMTSRDNKFWKCWSCGLSADKIKLFRLSSKEPMSYAAAVDEVFRHYGIDPPDAETTGCETKTAWLSYEETEALGLKNGIQSVTEEGLKYFNICQLSNEDPQLYRSLIVARAEEMIRKYKSILDGYCARDAEKAHEVYSRLGSAFDESSYNSLKTEVLDRIRICKSLMRIYG